MTNSLIRYTYLAFPLKRINVYSVYVALFVETSVSFALGMLFFISDYVEIENLHVALLQGLSVLLLLLSPIDAVLIVSLYRALSRFTIVNKEGSKKHSKAVKRLTIINISGSFLAMPFAIVTLYYTDKLNLYNLLDLFELDFAVTCSYYVLINFHGFVPSVNILWNDKIRKYYTFKRHTGQMRSIEITTFRKSSHTSGSVVS